MTAVSFFRMLMCAVGAGALLAGCGSIHVGTTSSIHVYAHQVVSADDMTPWVHWVNKIRLLQQPQEEKLAGFRWDEQELKIYKKVADEEIR